MIIGRALLCSCLVMVQLSAAEPTATATVTGPLVVQVLPGGQCEDAGVLVGDILMSYRDVALTSRDQLPKLIQDGERNGNIAMLVVDRGGQVQRFAVKAGRLGLDLLDVVQGEPLPVLPPGTLPGVDFSRLAEMPCDHWYRLVLGGRPVGFAHHRLAIDPDGMLQHYSEVGFDPGEPNGLQHFQVTTTARIADGLPVLTNLRFVNPQTGLTFTYAAEQTGTRRGLGWTARIGDENESGRLELDLVATRAVPTYLLNLLPAFLPQEPGACLRLTQLIDGEPRTGRPVALVVVGTDPIQHLGQELSACRIEERFFGQTGNVHWVTADGSIVRSQYASLLAELLATRDEALAGVHRDILRKTRRE